MAGGPTVWEQDHQVSGDFARGNSVMAVAADGTTMVVWEDTTGGSGGKVIRAKIIGFDGDLVMGPFDITSGLGGTSAELLPSVTALADGTFAVSWFIENELIGSRHDYRKYGADGAILHDSWAGASGAGTIFSYGAGGHGIISGSGSSLSIRNFDANGDPTTIHSLNTFGANCYRLAATSLSGGAAVIAYGLEFENGGGTISLSIRRADGSEVALSHIGIETGFRAEHLTVNAQPASAGGGFIVTWIAPVSGQTGFAIRSQHFNSTGVAQGGVFQINSDPRMANPSGVDAAVLPNGQTVYTWAENVNGSTVVKARIYSGSTPVGSDFVVGTEETLPHQQLDPQIISHNDGRFTISWTNAWHVNGGPVRSKTYDTRESGITWDGKASENDSYVGTVGNDVLTGGGSGRDRLSGHDGNDRLYGGWGNDTLKGGRGNDTIDGGQGGSDSMSGGDGIDVLTYAAYTDLSGSNTGITLYLDPADQSKNAGAAGGDRVQGFEKVIGTQYADTIVGSAIAETIEGGNGSDFLWGGGGADSLVGGAGTDWAWYGDSSEGLVLSLKDSRDNTGIAAGDKYDSIEALSGSDHGDEMYASDAGNTLFGRFGNDTLVGGTGSDYLDGGQDADTIRGGNGNDELIGFSENDYLDGGGHNDTLYGGEGNDTLDGGEGNDRMFGGKGDDVYFLNGSLDVIDESFDADGGIDTVITNRSYTLVDGLENGTVHDSVDKTVQVNLIGNSAKNILTGHGGANLLNGGGNDDTLIGGGGDDNLRGGAGNDTYHVGSDGKAIILEAENEGAGDVVIATGHYTLGAGVHVETLQASGTDDTRIDLTGNELGNTLIGHGGRNYLSGRGGNDTLIGGNGHDTFDGGLGADSMKGGSGNDTYYIDNENDKIDESEGAGTETVITTINYTLRDENLENATVAAGFSPESRVDLTGNNGVNILVGHLGANSLNGGADNDRLYGNGGGDTLNGGLGADFMMGSGDNDVYYVDNKDDVISDAGGDQDTVIASINYTLIAQVENATVDPDVSFETQVDLIGNTSKNLLTGHEGANSLNGGDNDDTLIGGDGHDILQGGLGADSMVGGAGNDLFYVDQDSDVVDEDTSALGGRDTVEASADYTLTGGTGIEVLRAAEGDAHINLTGNERSNLIIGNAGNNVLKGGGGADDLQGGEGNDTYWIDADDKVTDVGGANGGTNDSIVITGSGSYTLVEFIENGRIDAGVRDVILTGNDGNNILTGNDEANVIIGGKGDDVITGGGGADNLQGGEGNDTYWVDGNDTVTEDLSINGGTKDTVNYTVGGTYTLGAGIENGRAIRTAGIINITGNNADNEIIGNNSRNILQGGQGNDTLDGFGDADWLDGGSGNDSLLGGSGNDSLYGGSGDDDIDGGDEDDVLIGGTGNNTLTGGRGNDTLKGGAGANTMEGGAGDDIYYVGADDMVEVDNDGNDTAYVLGYTFANKASLDDYVRKLKDEKGIETVEVIWGISETGNDGDNTLEGGEGNDTLDGGKGNDVIIGNGGDDILIGGADNDSINGGNGNDILDGGTGNDTLDGGAGNDVMTGGNGNDIYYVRDAGDVIVESTDPSGGLQDKAYIFIDSFKLGDDVGVEWLEVGKDVNFRVSITGNNLANTIIGGQANDTLKGGEGSDSLVGGGGNDTLFSYDLESDAVDSSNTLEGGSGNDTYWIRRGDIIIEDADENVGGHDKVYLTSKDFLMEDGETIDWDAVNLYWAHLLGRGIEDVYLDGEQLGGSNNNIYEVRPGSKDIVESTDPEGGFDTAYIFISKYELNDTIGVEWLQIGEEFQNSDIHIIGNKYDNTIIGGFANDTLEGRDGDDTLKSIDGADSLDGGSGHDTLEGGAGNDTLIGGIGNDSVDGGADDDRLTGGGGSDTLLGGLGNDTLIGSTDAASRLVGGAGDDVYYIRNRGDVVVEVGDTLAGGNDTAYIYTIDFGSVAQRDAYRDTLLANGIETVIVDDGPPPPDNRAPNGTLNAKTVREHLGTGSTVGLFSLTDEDNDPVSISLKNDAGGRFILDGNRLKVKDHTKIDFEASPAGRTLTVVVEISDGRTTVEKTFTIGVRNVFIDNVTGTAADETIYGGASTDILRGEGGNDRLVGGQGADNLWGGLGNDELTGGFGKDAFVFNQAASATNVDTITDFAVNDDLIRLSKSAFTAFSTTASGVLSGSAFALGTQAQDADDRIVYHQESGTLYYDADGVGGASAIIFAKLSNATKPLLSNTHFIIF